MAEEVDFDRLKKHITDRLDSGELSVEGTVSFKSKREAILGNETKIYVTRVCDFGKYCVEEKDCLYDNEDELEEEWRDDCLDELREGVNPLEVAVNIRKDNPQGVMVSKAPFIE